MLMHVNKRLAGFRRDEKGGVAMMAAGMATMMVALTGLIVDSSNIWSAKAKLQASTDAVALAVAYDIENNTTISQASLNTTASTYAVGTGDDNAYPVLHNATVSVTPQCFSSTGLSCSTTYTPTTGSATTINGATITQTASVNLFFGGLIGLSSKTLTATALAESQLGRSATTTSTTVAPLDSVVIIDTTASMGSGGSDSCTLINGGSGTTSIACALNGVQAMLKGMNPCDATLGCGTVTNGVAAHPGSQVALAVFPPLSTAYDASGTTQQSKDYDCSGSTNPTTSHYNTSGVTWKNYIVLPFQSDYKTSNSATSLNPSSNLVIAVGGSTTCGASAGLATPGGSGTYVADAITAATTYLTNNGRSGSTRAIVLFSDGDAQSSYAPTTNYSPITSSTNVSMSSTECQAAIAAGEAATKAGITVYAFAYGSPTSGGCQDSSSLSPASGLASGVSVLPQKNVTPCQAMKYIASSAATFYADSAGNGCANSSYSSNNVTSGSGIQTLFTNIGTSLQASTTVTQTTTTTRPRILKTGTN